MVQIIIARNSTTIQVVADVDDLSKGSKEILHPIINEVVKVIPSDKTAAISGDDITITPNGLIPGGAINYNLVEADSVPEDWAAHKYTYDGSWAFNPYFADLKREPKPTVIEAEHAIPSIPEDDR